MAEKTYYKSNGTEYNPDYDYTFTDKNGNTFTANGRNGYVWQAITEGVPISVNEKGEWYIEPYMDVTPQNIVVHMPEWFKKTDEYEEWKSQYAGYLQPGINAETYNKLQNILKELGGQGAGRVALTNRISSKSITDPGLQQKYATDFIGLAGEGQGYGDAKIQLYEGGEAQSAAEIARDFQKLSKEDLSRTIDALQKTIDAPNKEGWGGTLEEQKDVLAAFQILEILNHVDDNYQNYGNGEEFQGLLEASAWQKIYSGIEANLSQITNNGPLSLLPRLAHGFMSIGLYGKFDTNLSQYSDYTTDYSAGAWLEGRDGFISIGNAIGTVQNLVTMFTVSAAMGGWVKGLAAGMAGSGGAILSSMGTFMQSPIGSPVTDFFLHDVPIDLMNAFTTLSENNWDWGKMWYDPTQEQNLIAVPFIGELGPKVSAGLLNDLQGDIVVDFALPVLGALNKSFTAQFDSITNGAVTRFKEHVAVKNLKFQETLKKTPILGKGWKKMMQSFMGPEAYAFISQARKTSIVTGSMDWYKNAQNILTLKNHGGAEEVSNLYKALLDKTGALSAIQDFQKAARDYGGIGKTQVEWKETKGGEVVTRTRTVADVLPKDVKEGLLAIDRLSELKGSLEKEGGLISNPAREAEIKELEMKVNNLSDEIKEYANKFSEANKGLERIAVELGIKNEDWYKAMEMDPKFENYMTRQALVPGQGRAGGDAEPAQLFKSRKGYYADNYIDPTIALNMKAAALGRAYAWNLEAKTLVAMQTAQGKVIAGKGGADAAAKLAEIKKEIGGIEALRKQIDYDGTIKGISEHSAAVSGAIRNINDILRAPEKISLESIYSAATPPAITEFVGQFNAGKIRFGDGVRAAANLTDMDASYMVRNTYSLTRVTADGSKEAVMAAADSAIRQVASGPMYNAGVAPDGTAYRYTIKDGVITDIKEITDAAGMAQTIERLGGVHHIDPKTVEKMGVENSRALNRVVMYYRDNMPNLRNGSTFKCEAGSGRAMGWVPGFGSKQYKYSVENGHIVSGEHPVYMASAYYKKENGQVLNDALRRSDETRWHPKNAIDPAQVPMHEMGHSTMAKLCLYRVNEKIDSGELKLPERVHYGEQYKDLEEAAYQTKLGQMIDAEETKLNAELAKRALKRCGYEFNEQNFKKVWRQASYDNISRYAGDYDGRTPTYQWETYSEAIVDVWANGDGASKFSLAIVEEMRHESQRFSMAASPMKAMQQNGLNTAGLFKGDQYAFPASAKTNKQKAKWLAEKRAENPYIKTKGKFDVDQYKLANKWDTFFKKEIEAYDPNCKTAAPDVLIKKSSDFIEDMNKNAAKQLVAEINKISAGDFNEDLAMIALGRSPADVADALDNYIIRNINDSAQKIAAKMDGGATEANLNRARITLWQDERVKGDMSRMLSSMAPDLSTEDITQKIDVLFKEQAEGLASYEALPIDYKQLNEESIKLHNEIEKSNSFARKRGAEIEKKLAAEGFRDTTQTIHFREGGEDVYVVVSDPVTASILKRPDDFKNTGATANAFLYAANTMARMYRLGTTGLNPIALVRNVLRDPLQATLTAGFNPLTMGLDPTYYYKSWRQYGLDDATIKAVEQKLQTWASSGTMTNEIRSFGGELPGTAGYRNKAEQFEKWLNKKMDNKVINALESPLEMWESMFRNQVAQQSFTKALKRTGGDVDKALASAMFDASNATTNFSHSIYFMRRFSGSVPYLASAINGTASFWRLFNIDPIGMMGRITAGVMVPVAAITAWNLGDEERRKAYMNLPEWYRDGHLVLVDMEGNIFSLPIPDEIGNYFGTVRRLVEYTNEVNPRSIPSILMQGAFGFFPGEVDGFFAEDGSFDIQRGVGQFLSGLMPQTATVLYELAFNEKLFTGQDITNYNTFDKIVNTLGNTFGSFAVNIVNDLGFLAGASSKEIVGKSTAETLARDLFGIGFNQARDQFMSLVGNPEHLAEDGKTVIKASGLFKEAEDIRRKMEDYDKKIAFADEDQKETLEKERAELIENFGQRVKNLMDKYMALFSTTGGLELWKRKKLIQLLALGQVTTSAGTGTWQEADATQAELNEYALGRQRYVDLGLPSDPTVESLAKKENGRLANSISLQAKIDSFYGAPKQATQDYKKAIEDAGIKDIRDRFYATIQKVYDIADEKKIDPDYDLIEKIQARYLQSVDSVLIPIINKYGLSILNNNDFIDAVRRQVNGMIPSDDWKQSRRNAKKFLSKKDFPTATVDVKKWLKERYTSNMRDRGLDSDPEVTSKLKTIKSMIDRGEKNAAKGEIESLNKGINQSQYYISSKDYQTLVKYYNMVK